MKFLVDAPLGGLAKWLRFCGFDTTVRPLSARGPLPQPQADTFILTLQTSLARFGRGDIVILRAAAPEAQLREVLRRLKVSRRDLDLMSRCVKCNEALVPLSRDAVAGRVPEYIWHTQKEFYECPACRRVYWPGSHTDGISRKVHAALGRSSRRSAGGKSPSQRSTP
ncbi:MAG: hypothetical protein JRI59_08835 [Deltaproteobacteria bacterium]|nr:hypothetical protein [Deltaproteobacteria bacterium]